MWATYPSKAGGLQRTQHPHQYPGTGNSVDGLSEVWRIDEGGDSLLPDRQHNSSGLSVEGGMHLWQDPKFKHWGTPIVDLFARSQAHKVPQYINLDLSDKRASVGRCLEREVSGRAKVCLPTSKHHPDGPGQASKMGRGPDHDHTLLTRLEVPTDHVPSNRATRNV